MTGVTEKLFMCQMFMCLFRPLNSETTQSLKTNVEAQPLQSFKTGTLKSATGSKRFCRALQEVLS